MIFKKILILSTIAMTLCLTAATAIYGFDSFLEIAGEPITIHSRYVGVGYGVAVYQSSLKEGNYKVLTLGEADQALDRIKGAQPFKLGLYSAKDDIDNVLFQTLLGKTRN